jgi:hypothetical protein
MLDEHAPNDEQTQSVEFCHVRASAAAAAIPGVILDARSPDNAHGARVPLRPEPREPSQSATTHLHHSAVCPGPGSTLGSARTLLKRSSHRR